MQKLTPFRFILPLLRPYKWCIGALVFAAICIAADITLRSYLLKLLLDTLTTADKSKVFEQIGLYAGLYIGAALWYQIVFRIIDYAWLHFNPPLKRDISELMMNRMMQHSYSFFQDNFAGSMASKIKDVMSGVPDLVRFAVNKILSNFIAIIIACAALMTVHPKFALALLAWLIIYITGSWIFLKKGKVLSADSAEKSSQAVGQMVDTLSNMNAVRLFNGVQQEQSTLKKILNDYVSSNQRRDRYFMWMFTFKGVSFVIYQSICMYWLISGYRTGIITAGDFAFILTLNITFIDTLWQIAMDVSKMTDLWGVISQALNLALQPIEITDKPNAKELKVTKGQISFDHVHFHYKGHEPLFQNKSVLVQPGQKVGLVGYSGSGKTTFVNLIMRIFDIHCGKITIDGQDIRDVTQDSLHQAIAMIPQDPILFHRTLMENIRYSKNDATDAEVFAAAKLGQCDRFIEALPLKYQAVVGERGVKLSGGQRQRVAIARAFLKNAPILILDEATSQLDTLTEREIQASLKKLFKGKTTIVIAHRLSTLQQMDRILVFDQGRIVQDGPHDELLNQKGLYKTLWNAQVDGFLPEGM